MEELKIATFESFDACEDKFDDKKPILSNDVHRHKEIVDLLINTHIPILRIANMYGYKSKDPIYSIAERYNIDLTGRRFYKMQVTKEQEDTVCDLYINNHYSKRRISEITSLNTNIISKILADKKVPLRNHGVCEFDENYFDSIDTQNKAYLLGFLFADGCIQKNNVVSIVVHEKDIEILHYLKSELSASNTISRIKHLTNNGCSFHVRINFCSKHMCDSLIKLGCNRNKTRDLKFPNIPEEYKWHFIRGFMDGDGCISLRNRNGRKYLSLSFTGTNDMMNSLKKLFVIDNRVTFYRGAYSLHIGKKTDIIRILSLIYENSQLYLSRKYEKYQEFLQYIEDNNE